MQLGSRWCELVPTGARYPFAESYSYFKCVDDAASWFTVLSRTKIARKKEDDMENLVMLGQAAAGLGVLLLGAAAIWFVSVYSEKND